MSTSPLSVHDDPRIARQLVLGVFTTEDDGLGIVDCADGDGARSDSRPPTKNHPELLACQRQIGSRLARLFVNRHGCAGGVYRSDLNAWIAKAGTQHAASSKHDCEKPGRARTFACHRGGHDASHVRKTEGPVESDRPSLMRVRVGPTRLVP